MKVIVTGAGGFIGTHVSKYFAAAHYEVSGWDIVDKKEDILIHKVDMLNTEDLCKQLKKESPDIIIHCAGAADVGKSVENPFMDYEKNVTITHNLLFAMHMANLQNTRLVFLSSAAVYGNPECLPIREDSKLNPLSPYALHKVMCEDICLYMHDNYGMDVKVLRIFSAYGEGLKKQIFWDMYSKAKATGQLSMFGTGNESRDYINIKDLIRAIYIISTQADQNEVIYNVGSGEETTIREAVECFANTFGIEEDKIYFNGETKEGNPINWIADITKLKKLGYREEVKFYNGITSYINWAQSIEE